PYFQKAADEFDLDLANAKIEPGKIILRQLQDTNVFIVPIDAGTNFNFADFDKNLSGKAKAFADERVWQMGIVLAAQQLQLDLANAEIDLSHGKIILRGANGIVRTIPV